MFAIFSKNLSSVSLQCNVFHLPTSPLKEIILDTIHVLFLNIMVASYTKLIVQTSNKIILQNQHHLT